MKITRNRKEFYEAVKQADKGETIIFNEHDIDCCCSKCSVIEQLQKIENIKREK